MALEVNPHVKRLRQFQPFQPDSAELVYEQSDPREKRYETVALGYLALLVEEPGVKMIVLTGDAGHGKTSLCAKLLERFGMDADTAAEAIRDTANMHVIEDLVDVNWGLDEQAPKLGFDEIGSRKDAVASAIQQLVAAGVLLPDRSLEEAVRQSYGLPAKDWVSTEDLARKRADAAAAEVAAFAEVGLAPPVDGKAAGAGVVAPPTPPVEPGTTDETGKPAFAKAGGR